MLNRCQWLRTGVFKSFIFLPLVLAIQCKHKPAQKHLVFLLFIALCVCVCFFNCNRNLIKIITSLVFIECILKQIAMNVSDGTSLKIVLSNYMLHVCCGSSSCFFFNVFVIVAVMIVHARAHGVFVLVLYASMHFIGSFKSLALFQCGAANATKRLIWLCKCWTVYKTQRHGPVFPLTIYLYIWTWLHGILWFRLNNHV